MSSRSQPDGLRVVAISPNLAGSAPAGMNGEFSRMTIMSSPETSTAPPSNDPTSVAFVKGGKRKRLSKVRCYFDFATMYPPLAHLTVPRRATLVTKVNVAATVQVSCAEHLHPPCLMTFLACAYTLPQPPAATGSLPFCRLLPPCTSSDKLSTVSSYFASKECTYTDSSGRPVPAPRISTQDRSIPPSQIAPRNLAVATAYVDPTRTSITNTTSARRQTDFSDAAAKRARPEALSPSSSGSIASSPSLDSGNSSPTTLLDPVTTHELTNRTVFLPIFPCR